MSIYEVQVLLLILLAICVVLGVLVAFAWLLIRSGMISHPIGACMFAAFVLSAVPVVAGGRVLTGWPSILVSVFVIGLPIGILWQSEREYQRRSDT